MVVFCYCQSICVFSSLCFALMARIIASHSSVFFPRTGHPYFPWHHAQGHTMNILVTENCSHSSHSERRVQTEANREVDHTSHSTFSQKLSCFTLCSSKYIITDYELQSELCAFFLCHERKFNITWRVLTKFECDVFSRAKLYHMSTLEATSAETRADAAFVISSLSMKPISKM